MQKAATRVLPRSRNQKAVIVHIEKARREQIEKASKRHYCRCQQQETECVRIEKRKQRSRYRSQKKQSEKHTERKSSKAID